MCIFCEILKGNIPSAKVYEDDEVLAILDISQTTYGHTLVMPKKHYNNFLEMPNDEYASLMSKVQNIAQTLQNKLKCNGMNLLINTNEVAGQTVMHTHVHLIPRYTDQDTVKFEFKENKYNLEEIQCKLKQI